MQCIRWDLRKDAAIKKTLPTAISKVEGYKVLPANKLLRDVKTKFVADGALVVDDLLCGEGVFEERCTIKEHPEDVVIDGHHDPGIGRVRRNGYSTSN